jgi:hypothetical protein
MSIFYFPKQKRKTPKELQLMYENQYRKHFKIALPIVLIFPCVLISLALILCWQLSPDFNLLNRYVISVIMVFYMIFCAIGWFLIGPDRPSKNLGNQIRELVDKYH